MNKITTYAPEGGKHVELTVRIGNRFQSVSIKKTANKIDIADSLRKLADNLEHDDLMGVKDETNSNEPTCKICAAFEYMNNSTGCGWCHIRKASVHKDTLTCKEFGI